MHIISTQSLLSPYTWVQSFVPKWWERYGSGQLFGPTRKILAIGEQEQLTQHSNWSFVCSNTLREKEKFPLKTSIKWESSVFGNLQSNCLQDMNSWELGGNLIEPLAIGKARRTVAGTGWEAPNQQQIISQEATRCIGGKIYELVRAYNSHFEPINQFMKLSLNLNFYRKLQSTVLKSSIKLKEDKSWKEKR